MNYRWGDSVRRGIRRGGDWEKIRNVLRNRRCEGEKHRRRREEGSEVGQPHLDGRAVVAVSNLCVAMKEGMLLWWLKAKRRSERARGR